MARRLLAGLFLLDAACTAPARPSPPAPLPARTETPAPVTTAAAPPAEDAGTAVDAVAPLAPLLPPAPPFPQPPRATPGPGELAIEDAVAGVPDLSAWLAARHLPPTVVRTLRLLDRSCSTLVIAGSTGDLLACRDGGMDDTGCFDRWEILAVQNGSARSVFAQTYSLLSSCDEPGPGVHRVEVSVWVKDGRELVVREDGGTCAVLSEVTPAFRNRAAALCHGVGRYTWNGARFVRVGPPP